MGRAQSGYRGNTLLDHPRMSRVERASKGVWVLLCAAAAGACIYDGDDRCGPNMELSAVESCDCIPGYVLEGASCVVCPEHEIEERGACVCAAGFQRPSAGAACVEPPPETPGAGLGARCSDSQRCTDPAFDHCAEASNGDRYCTQSSCGSSDDCAAGYACSNAADGSYCQRSPLGLESPCATQADCAGTEATYCETLISQSCLVQGCSLSANDCFEGWECCDASAYGMPIPLCVPSGECPT